jgi:hypothetical protein
MTAVRIEAMREPSLRMLIAPFQRPSWASLFTAESNPPL